VGRLDAQQESCSNPQSKHLVQQKLIFSKKIIAACLSFAKDRIDKPKNLFLPQLVYFKDSTFFC